MKRPLEIDMCAGSQLRDTQGETLSIEGADISELISGRGRINDNHGKGFFNCIGKVTAAKKIFKREDCEDSRQLYYWEKIKSPYLYVKAQLFDDEDHPNARAAAAILRNIHKSDCPLKIKASVEGGVVARGIKDPTLLAKTKVHSVALTFVPANHATLVEPLNLDKSADTQKADRELIKSVLHLAQTDVPSFRHITRHASASKIEANVNKILDLMGDNKSALKLKKALIEDSLETRIIENVQKINRLVSQLVKAIPGPDEDAYNIKQGYTGKDSFKAQIRALGEIQHYDVHGKHIKTMKNPNTGKNEPHVLLHNGMSSKPVANPNLESSRSTPFKVTPNTFGHDKHAVHAIDMGAANYYAEGEGGLYSFWVPVSHIEATRRYMDSRWNNPNMPDHPDWEGDPEARHYMINDPWVVDQGHIIVKPGTYQRATKKEMQEIHNSYLKNKNKEVSKWALRNKKPQAAKAARNNERDFIDDNGRVKKLSSIGSRFFGNYDGPMDPRLQHRFPEDEDEHISKALTAEYGGAGSPANLTHGGVLQPESLDKTPPKSTSFRFISCDYCGKEQVYGKFQVKCRNCSKAFSMAKLEKFFRG